MHKALVFVREKLADCFVPCVLLVLIVIALVYCTNAGQLVTRPFDPALLSEPNPARREIEIERANVLTATVTDISRYKALGVTLELKDYPGVTCTAWLEPEDVAGIMPGDVVTLKGHIKYYPNETGPDAIVIGDAISAPPMSFSAKIVSK